MLTLAERQLCDEAARALGMDEISFTRLADERGVHAGKYARQVLQDEAAAMGAKQAAAPSTTTAAATAPRRPVPESTTSPPATGLAAAVEKWVDDYDRAAKADDVDGLLEIVDSARQHLKDPAGYLVALALSTIHKIKREALEQRLAALEQRKSFQYCGVWDESSTYDENDFVTLGGSMWHCSARTTAKPGTSEAWQLAVKHGRDAR